MPRKVKADKDKNPVARFAGLHRWAKVTKDERHDMQSKWMKDWWARQPAAEVSSRMQALAKARGTRTYTTAQVKQIVKLFLTTKMTVMEISKKMDMHLQAVYAIVRGHSWVHISGGDLRPQRKKMLLQQKPSKAA